MRPMLFMTLLALGFLGAAVPGAATPLTSTSSTDGTVAQTDTTMAKPDSTAAKADTTAAPPSTPAATPVAAPAPVAPPPAPVSTPAATPAAVAAAPAAASTPAPSKIYYGGTVTLSFGSTTRVGIFPMLGYKLTPKLSGGVEAGYEYVSYGSNQSTHNYGGSVFGRLRISRSLYAHAEYQAINYEIFTGNQSNREWVPFLLLGGGFVKPLNARTSFYAEVLFDVLQDDKSPYENWEPVVSVGVAVGF